MLKTKLIIRSSILLQQGSNFFRATLINMTEPLLELDESEMELDRQPAVVHQSTSESQPPSRPAHFSSQPEREHTHGRQDLVDTFNLFKTYLDNKFTDFKSDYMSQQDALTKRFRDESTIKFKSEGNRIQYRFNEDILDGLNQLHRLVPSTDKAAVCTIDLITKVKERNKLIRIADNSAGGWATVREYESSGYADDEEDEKRIRQAENRALRSIKDKRFRTQPYPQFPVRPPVAPAAQTVPNPAYNITRYPPPPFRNSVARREPCLWDTCYICKQPGHWKNNCPLNPNSFKTSTNNIQQHPSNAAKQ